MSASRLAAWIIGAAVCGAWLASAAGVTRQARNARVAPRPADTVQFDVLAADVQSQADRLRERLANAPTPRATDRNPFEFDSAPVRRPAIARAPLPVSLPEPAVPEIRDPALQLIGIAESAKG